MECIKLKFYSYGGALKVGRSPPPQEVTALAAPLAGYITLLMWNTKCPEGPTML